MVDETKPILIEVQADRSTVASANAMSLGFIVTELVINALKYAFPAPSRADARILITYQVDGSDWKLAISDNGVGASASPRTGSGGLGTAIVTALAKQLDGRLEVISNDSGMCISVTHETFTSHLPVAA
jgi:chemotaxis protein methyltransferase CheR